MVRFQPADRPPLAVTVTPPAEKLRAMLPRKRPAPAPAAKCPGLESHRLRRRYLEFAWYPRGTPPPGPGFLSFEVDSRSSTVAFEGRINGMPVKDVIKLKSIKMPMDGICRRWSDRMHLVVSGIGGKGEGFVEVYPLALLAEWLTREAPVGNPRRIRIGEDVVPERVAMHEASGALFVLDSVHGTVWSIPQKGRPFVSFRQPKEAALPLGSVETLGIGEGGRLFLSYGGRGSHVIHRGDTHYSLVDADADGRFERVEERTSAEMLSFAASLSASVMDGERHVRVDGTFGHRVQIQDERGAVLAAARIGFRSPETVKLRRQVRLGKQIRVVDLDAQPGFEGRWEKVEPMAPDILRHSTYDIPPKTGATLWIYGRNFHPKTRAEIGGKPAEIEVVDSYRLRIKIPPFRGPKPKDTFPIAPVGLRLLWPGLKEPLDLDEGAVRYRFR